MRWGILLLAGVAWAQTPVIFEVATIKPAPAQEVGRTSSRMSSDTDTGKLAYSNVNLKQVIASAYKVQQYQVGGPDWINTERFDIVAKFAPHSAPDHLRLMLQALLSDRFKLMLHRETRELPVYDLTVAKGGPKFKAADSESLSINSNRTHWHVEAKVNMRRLAEVLSDEAGRPVLDKTGLAGRYELALDWVPDDAVPTTNDATTGPSLFTAPREEWSGLKLEPAKAPVETLGVDHAERTPTDN